MAGVAVALTATTGAGVSYADDGKPLGVPSSLSADGKFFTPGPNTLVKRNSSAAESGELSTEAPSSISPRPQGRLTSTGSRTRTGSASRAEPM